MDKNNKIASDAPSGASHYKVPNLRSSDAPSGASHTYKFFYVYILRSLIKDWLYVGYSTDLKRRIDEHNSGKTSSTKKYKPLELIHYEAYRNIRDAKRREFYLKTTKGKTTLRTMLTEYFKQNNKRFLN